MSNTDFNEFLSLIGLNSKSDWHIVYELWDAARNLRSGDYFTVNKDNNDHIYIVCNYDHVVKLALLSQKAQETFISLLESEYMYDLDGESYWGYHTAIENDKD